MAEPSPRSICRIALLQDYAGRPERLLDELPEVARKGYHGVDAWVGAEDLDFFRRFCERACALGLSAGAATCYMIGQFTHLARHPEQRMVLAEDDLDTDGMGLNTWGCPFNPDFKTRYVDMLRGLAAFPGAARVWINDEASLSSGCYCRGCVEAYRREFGCKMPSIAQASEASWRDERWRRFLQWRIERWIAIHAELTEAIHAVNPAMCVGFQSSPGVDLWRSPWYSAVDLHGMSHVLDAVSVDPYYTFHRHPVFAPAEVYLSEWSRFLTGITRPGTRTQLVVQGFSHPDFTRPLNEADGVWTALVPPACGVDMVMPYSYTLQRCSPVQAAYERCMKLDPWFARSTPLKYAAIVHGFQTEVYARPLPRDTPASYDGTRLFPVAESLRQHGIPYGYVADAALDEPDILRAYKVLVLPDVVALSTSQRAGVESYLRTGGNVVVCGDLGSHDETGSRVNQSLLEQLSGIRVESEAGPGRSISACDAGVALPDRFAWIDDRAMQYWEGAYAPVRHLSDSVRALVPESASILARFDEDGTPAIASTACGHGRLLWFAGIPTRTVVTPGVGSEVLNITHQWLAQLTRETAGSPPLLRVEGWPPDVPIRRLRPVDRRHVGTFEFFPLVGDGFFLALVTSYFREPAKFRLSLTTDRRVTQVTELLHDRRQQVVPGIGGVSIEVDMGFDDAAKCYFFELGRE